MAAADTIIAIGLTNATLRNEIYCQICKQIIGNDTPSLQRAWELMAFVCGTFPPNHQLLKYIGSFCTFLFFFLKIQGSFLLEHSKKNVTFASFCSKLLEKTYYYGERGSLQGT